MPEATVPETTVPETPGPAIRLTAEAWESLFRAQVAVMRRLRNDPSFKKLAIGEYDVLFNLSRCPTGWTRLNELNRHLLISQPSLSRMAERLEAKGLIQRKPAPDDQRGVMVGLTDSGRELQREIGAAHVRVIYSLLGPVLATEELEQLLTLTRRIRDGVDDPERADY
ncbi:DNA-binding MarR family transcriptional regulator [Arthrobacter sp. CAN_A212]|uniref:MarR family winged helix-turn-helix transcriptional regulator n=1 Tax=unclassified Arthrobacter TaxID=235627 RepID=UPI001A1A3D9F|nr:MarR family winged helix-turn-helix transcriptional regulator [Arthrobacter sp. CAN_C5]MBP2216215.1 DNA-binding MarR family transcriptional regulator [Arthrobacter sp. CAN_C5]